MHFHPRWSGLVEGFGMEATIHEMAVTGMSASNRIGGLQHRKIGQSGMPNRTIQFPRRQQEP
jgi:hypothetical protein